MLTPITFPKFKLTLGATPYENIKVRYAKVIRNENGFDIATINLNDTSLYPGTVTTGTAVKLEVGEKGSAYPTSPMFKGVARFPVVELSKNPTLTLSCLGSGYGLGQMLVGDEYGTQSANPTLNTIKVIVDDLFDGIIRKYVNRVFGAGADGDSGFNYTTNLYAIAGNINYISFPYKPAFQCLNDLCDLVTALRAGATGPHWIVTTDNVVRIKLLDDTWSDWVKYYGGSQANSTISYGEHYDVTNMEIVGPEANYILYYGVLRKPPRDVLTESVTGWADTDVTLTADAGGGAGEPPDAVAGDYMLKAASEIDGTCHFWYNFPTAMDFTKVGSVKNPPTVNFLLACNDISDSVQIGVNLYTTRGVAYFSYLDSAAAWTLQTELAQDSQFQFFSIPIGPYAELYYDRNVKYHWSKTGAGNWAVINGIDFQFDGTADRDIIFIDDLRFEGLICRVASNSGISPYCMKLITDNVGKDDSLASNTTGMMAQLAYAELLRSQKTCTLGWTHLKGIIPEALPGQWFNQQTDMRATKIVQEFGEGIGFHTTLYLTTDLTNGRARMRYEDLNKVYADVRPEFQDRQATSIKAGQLDIDVPRLTVNYP